MKRYLCQTKEEIDYMFEKYKYNCLDFPSRITVNRKFEESKNVSFFFDDNSEFDTWCNFRCELNECKNNRHCEKRIDDYIIVRNWIRERKLERIIDEEIH